MSKTKHRDPNTDVVGLFQASLEISTPFQLFPMKQRLTLPRSYKQATHLPPQIGSLLLDRWTWKRNLVIGASPIIKADSLIISITNNQRAKVQSAPASCFKTTSRMAGTKEKKGLGQQKGRPRESKKDSRVRFLLWPNTLLSSKPLKTLQKEISPSQESVQACASSKSSSRMNLK